MKNLIFYISCFISINSFAQNSAGKSDDIGRITLAAYVPQQIDHMPVAARSMLANKLSQIATQSGMGGSAMNQRFIITANIVVLTKNITSTAPPMHAYTLDITLYIGDGIDGTKFASTSVSAKGVGETETKAYISALKSLKTNDSRYQSFIESGKTKIVEYYNSKCDFIIKESQTLANQGQFDEAIYKLTSVPEVCKDCYDECMDAVAPIYQKQIDKECKSKLMEANTAWNASQDSYGADTAGAILAQIDSNAACYKEALALSNKIAQKVKEIDQREWKYQLKQQQDNVDIKKETIKAVRDIGVAYGNGPKASVVRYNVRGWW